MPRLSAKEKDVKAAERMFPAGFILYNPAKQVRISRICAGLTQKIKYDKFIVIYLLLDHYGNSPDSDPRSSLAYYPSNN